MDFPCICTVIWFYVHTTTLFLNLLVLGLLRLIPIRRSGDSVYSIIVQTFQVVVSLQLHRPGSREFISVSLSAADPSCPVHPEPVPLPSPLPDSIVKALETLEGQISSQVNTTNVVRFYNIVGGCSRNVPQIRILGQNFKTLLCTIFGVIWAYMMMTYRDI